MPPSVDEALRAASLRLSATSISPRLDAEVLLSHVMLVNRSALLARVRDPLAPEQERTFSELVERRVEGEPVAYLTGHKEFYGLDLDVTSAVLVPRPETESVVEACLEALPAGQISHLADIGTGSGAIAVAVAHTDPDVRVYATELSEPALEVARRNVRKHNLEGRIQLLSGNLMESLTRKMHVIAANLPYVPPGEASPDVARWEPQVAVFGGGEDGTGTIRAFLADAPQYLLPGGVVVMETAHSQGALVSQLARQAFPAAHVEVRKDLAGYDRIVIIKT